ncbi:unnamed protein product [Symbiodinium natans]|uniref:Pentatricopeptide repeat-containing protein, chloroplastic n=1 Tax=Symbiodinium natans TaxID=878477 RepID=A0A812SVG6_9DINO|nr:unnamed protein product [Symbiodinium natans]
MRADPSRLSPIGLATKTIQGAGRRGQWREAVTTYHGLQASRLEADAVSCGAVLQACQASAWKLACSFLWQIQEASVELSLVCCNIAMSLSGQRESWYRTISMLIWMCSIAMRPDAQSYTPALGSSRTWGLSLWLLRQTRPNRILSNVAVASMARAWQWSFDLFYDLQAARPLPDTIFLNTFLSSLERSEQWQLAVSVLQASLKGSPVTPNLVSFNACLHACGEAAQLDQALQLVRCMEASRGPSPDVISYSAVLNACAKLVQWTLALDELGRMQRRSVLPDVVALNAAMSACAEAVQWEMCLHMLTTSSGVDPDSVSYNAVLKACEKSAQWALAMSMYWQMARSRVGCTTATYNTLLSCCQRSTKWEHATLLLSTMLSQHVLPDIISFNACLGALRRGSQWQQAISVFHWMPHVDVRSDTVTVVELFGALAAAARAPQARRVAASLVACAPLVRDCMQPALELEARRPTGLAVTACDCLVSHQLREPFECQQLLRRHGLRPVLRTLRRARWSEPSGRALQLRDPVLERQHSLGASLTKDALLDLEGREPELMPPPWMLRASQADASPLLLWLHEDPPKVGAYLRPVQVEHDRSSHAERQALLSLLAREAEATFRDGSQDFGDFRGAVRLYVTHTLCISCLAACYQYKALHPHLRLSVGFRVL